VNDNSLLDGDKAVTLTATVPGWSAATAALVVQDNEVPALDFMSYPVEVRESAGSGLGLYLTFGGTLVAPLTVSLSSSDITEMEFEQSQVTVPAGSESVTVYLKIIDDDLVDGAQNLTLTASAPGFATATKTAIIRDNEVGALIWGNVGGPVTAGAVLNTEITAQTIDGDPLTYNGQITFSAGGRPSFSAHPNGDGRCGDAAVSGGHDDAHGHPGQHHGTARLSKLWRVKLGDFNGQEFLRRYFKTPLSRPRSMLSISLATR
jgi:hypothetical protein